jgi:hypothetical protein
MAESWQRRESQRRVPVAFEGAFALRPGPILAALILSAFSPLGAHAFSASHDGRWQVELETTVGNCAKSGVAVLTVKGGQLAGIDASGVSPWGYIDESNTFVGHFNAGAKMLRANGDVKGNSASGPWSSQTDYCGGRWTAHKID